MRYTLAGPAGSFEFDAVNERVTREDPAAILDVDASGATLRVSTVLTERELLALAAPAGAAVRLRLEPSECCGGCGG